MINVLFLFLFLEGLEKIYIIYMVRVRQVVINFLYGAGGWTRAVATLGCLI